MFYDWERGLSTDPDFDVTEPVELRDVHHDIIRGVISYDEETFILITQELDAEGKPLIVMVSPIVETIAVKIEKKPCLLTWPSRIGNTRIKMKPMRIIDPYTPGAFAIP